MAQHFDYKDYVISVTVDCDSDGRWAASFVITAKNTGAKVHEVARVVRRKSCEGAYNAAVVSGAEYVDDVLSQGFG